MADFSDLRVATLAVADPATSAADLAAITEAQEGLWTRVAAHPNAYPELLEWLVAQGDELVRQTVAARPPAQVEAAPASDRTVDDATPVRKKTVWKRRRSAKKRLAVVIALVLVVAAAAAIAIGVHHSRQRPAGPTLTTAQFQTLAQQTLTAQVGPWDGQGLSLSTAPQAITGYGSTGVVVTPAPFGNVLGMAEGALQRQMSDGNQQHIDVFQFASPGAAQAFVSGYPDWCTAMSTQSCALVPYSTATFQGATLQSWDETGFGNAQLTVAIAYGNVVLTTSWDVTSDPTDAAANLSVSDAMQDSIQLMSQFVAAVNAAV